MKNGNRTLGPAVAAIALVGLMQAGTASAAIINFDLSDKGPGAIADPDYGLRLDDLFTNPKDSNWTFTFTENGAAVEMEVDTDLATVRIFGTVYGGRDTGGAWDPATVAFWNLDFLYADGVTIDDTVNGYWTVDMMAENFGYLELRDSVNVDGVGETDEGRFLGLTDFKGGSFVGNGGPNPQSAFVSAWLESTDSLVDSKDDLASLTYSRPNNNDCCNDFGFRATQTVPEPSSIALLGLGLVAGAWKTRRRRVAKSSLVS